ncbi:MAG: HNH endonuclease [Clostridia bacterium]|nr:HNH endonuclease [Clostridia bacterium]
MPTKYKNTSQSSGACRRRQASGRIFVGFAKAKAVLSRDLKYLNARAFNKSDINRKYKEQKGICPYCKNHFSESEMHGDHIRPWSKGGKTEYINLQMLCTECNLKKSNYDVGYNPWDKTIYEEFDIKKWNSK